MAAINVQFTDATSATITSYFGCPQNAATVANQGVIDTSDPRWKTFYNAQPEVAQAYLPTPD
ncbi:hypothetical protein [Paraburkholderia heleia]|uniref:hypothetical protein n=1 Tax=Paraburkholderia heleia TaxID=634127 RepID=UPI002AB616D1|nr:hypothetical protein [Paraburkholderia heleia]